MHCQKFFEKKPPENQEAFYKSEKLFFADFPIQTAGESNTGSAAVSNCKLQIAGEGVFEFFHYTKAIFKIAVTHSYVS